jgi:cell division protein FtsQ
MIALAVMVLVFGALQFEQFLITNSRFKVVPPAEYGDESPSLHLEGVQYASRTQILRAFQPDVGRSLFLVPLSDRRKTLLRIPWVKDAAITRTWPNQLFVRIAERRPAAFVQFRDDSSSRWWLIDPDGMILDPPQRAPFKLPVITGISFQEAVSMRSVRVHRMMRMLNDLGDSRDRVSEVDVADLDDLKVTLKMEDRAVVLMLGDHNFRTRFENFLAHYSEIQKRLTDTTTFDLRLDDRITVLGGKRVEPAL